MCTESGSRLSMLSNDLFMFSLNFSYLIINIVCLFVCFCLYVFVCTVNSSEIPIYVFVVLKKIANIKLTRDGEFANNDTCEYNICHII